MEKVVASPLHSGGKVVEKQLGEIEAKQHQNEAKRLKQIRDLGVDLAKIQKSRDLDDVMQGTSPRNNQQRRGSLPPLDSQGGLLFPSEQQRTPRSLRRLSCIADISRAPLEMASFLTDSTFSHGNPLVEKQLAAIKNECRDKKGDISTLNSEMICENNNLKHRDEDTDNTIIITVPSTLFYQPRGDSHEDIDFHPLDTDSSIKKNTSYEMSKTKSSKNSISDLELESIFADAKKGKRRSSEPELSSHFVRGMHNVVLSDIPLLQYPNDADSEELRKSIQINLPSNIVAEREEDELETSGHTDEGIDNAMSLSPNCRPRHRLSSISEIDDIYDASAMSGQTNDSCVDQLGANTLTVPGDFFSRRRKSDGDAFVQGFTSKCYSADKLKFGKVNRDKFDDLTTVKTSMKQNLQGIPRLGKS